MRKLIIIFIPILLVVIGLAVAFQLKPKGKVSAELSQRSKEYLEGETKDVDGDWAKMEFEGDTTPDTRNSVFNVDGCFNFKMLYRLSNQRIEGECEGYYAFNEPRGSVVAYLRPEGGEGMDYRMKNPDIYEQRSFSASGKNFIIFKTKESSYEATAYYLLPDKSGLTFTLKASTSKNLDSDLEKMLGSIEILK